MTHRPGESIGVASSNPGTRVALLLGARPLPSCGVLGRFRSQREKSDRRVVTEGSEPLAACAAALSETLPEDWRVLWATPRSVVRTVRQIVRSDVRDLVVLALHPEYCRAATGRMMQAVHRLLGRASHVNVTLYSQWNDDCGYVNAQARLVAEYATAEALTPENTHLIFNAQDWHTKGAWTDTYREQVEHTARLISERVGWPAAGTSVVLGQLDDVRIRAASECEGANVLVCPLDVMSGGPGRDVPIEAANSYVHVCPDVTRYEPFLAALKNLILRGPKPVIRGSLPVKPLLAPQVTGGSVDDLLASLVTVGVSLPGRVRSRRGPYVTHCDPGRFGGIKKSRRELRSFLEWVRGQERLSEGFVFNTCQRVEFYGWLTEPDNLAEREYVVAQASRRLFGAGGGELRVNVLFGLEAWHHLIRTAAGLNSELPGDADLVIQLQTSSRVAERAGSAGLRAARLVEDTVRMVAELRSSTSWGRFSPGYCLAALSRIVDVGGARLEELHHVTIGGSATSRSVIATLSASFGVPQRQITLVYRDHHGQMRLLRSALGQGKRLRVHSYGDQRVLDEIAAADLVYFGVDCADPVLDLGRLGGLRDFTQRPLTIIDFNTSGSLNGDAAPEGVTVWTAGELDRAVGAYADAMCAKEPFARAVTEAENWIECHLPATAASKERRRPSAALGSRESSRSIDAQAD